MAGYMVTNIVNVPVRIAFLTLTVWSVLIPHYALGAPTPTPKPAIGCRHRLKVMKTKIGCAGYTALISDSATSSFVLSVNTRQKTRTVVARNVTTHPVTLENLFLDDTVQDYPTKGVHRFTTIAGDYLSVDDGNGHLTISTRRQKANFYLVEKENHTTCLCALGHGRNHSFLVSRSPFSAAKPIKLQKNDCETPQKFSEALKVNEELKAAVEMKEYRFRLVPVTQPEAKYLVSEELKSVCCSFDGNCDITWFWS